jgi:hypothetical protein
MPPPQGSDGSTKGETILICAYIGNSFKKLSGINEPVYKKLPDKVQNQVY